MRKVIAFCGFEKAGKGFSCQRLLETKGFIKTSFANALRDIAFKTLNIPYEEGMKNYEELKKTALYNGLTFRNILENLGASVREYDKDFWARTVVKFIKDSYKNVCIDDLRYPNEYRILKDFCDSNDIEFKLVFCDYHSEEYRDDNPHESAQMAKFLKNRGYKDQEEVNEVDIADYAMFVGLDEEREKLEKMKLTC